MDAIVIENLTKRLGKRRILSNLNLEVLENESMAVLGLKDSGKTTLAKTLFNYIKPSKGKTYIYDLDCKKDSKAIKESVSFVPQEIIFDENSRAANIFKSTLNFHNLKNTDEIDKLCAYFNFNSRLKVADMNESEKRILSIINALIIRPRLLVIDEGLKELDSNQKDSLFSYLNEQRELDGLTVLLFTDSLIDAQRYCDRAAYLYKGEIKDIEYLKDKTSNDKIVKIFSPFDNIGAFLDIDAKLIKNEPYEKIFYYDKNMMILSRVIANCDIANYSIEDSSLSDKIRAYFEEGSQDLTNTYRSQEANSLNDEDENIENQNVEDNNLNSEASEFNPVEENIENNDNNLEETRTISVQEISDEDHDFEESQSTQNLQPLTDQEINNNEINGIDMTNINDTTSSYSEINETIVIENFDEEDNKEDI